MKYCNVITDSYFKNNNHIDQFYNKYSLYIRLARKMVSLSLALSNLCRNILI